MIERHQHLGHQILLVLEERTPTRFLWSWRIDGRHTARGKRPATAARARDEALFLARRLLDQWDQTSATRQFVERQCTSVDRNARPDFPLSSRLP